jgi:hypothetical protein
MQRRIEGLEAMQRQEAERQRAYLETIEKQRLEIIRLIDVALESAKAPSAKTQSRPADGRPKWLDRFCLCKRTGEVCRWTESGWVQAHWSLTPAQERRVREQLAKYPRSTR